MTAPRGLRALGFLGLIVALTLAPALVGQAAARRADPPPPTRTVTLEVFAQNGTISRVTRAVSDQGSSAGVGQAAVTPIQVTGPVANRIDLVFVGDGYTRSELGLFHQHVLSKWAELSSVEPYRTYRNFFNVWAVDVISRDSGVDNDPVVGIDRDTALNMTFFCAGIERLLCVDYGRTASYASQAPAVDHVIALANSTKYGGAGYNSSPGDLATASGGHALSGQIVVHELGHSIGLLADEYPYGGPEVWASGEPPEPNVSTYTAEQMAAGHLKWWRWLGEPSPDGGTVATYEGAKYSFFGIYRPTENSIMRVLGSEFNLPGREAMIEHFHLLAPIIGSVGDARVRGNATVDLGLPELVGDDYDITWYVDGVEVAAWADQDTVQLALTGRHRLDVRVVDDTAYVRDEAFRDRSMTFTRSWNVN